MSALATALRATYGRRAWLATVLAAQSFAAATVSVTVLVSLLVAAASTSWIPVPFGLGFLWLAQVCARGFARFESFRYAACLGEDLPLRPVLRPAHRSGSRLGRAWGVAWARIHSKGAWLGLAWALFVLPLFGWVGGALVFVVWGTGAAFLLFPAYGFVFARGDRLVGLDLGYGGSVAVHVAVGAVLLLAAPWLARGISALGLAAARAMLSPNETEALTRRVADLEASRAGMLSVAEAERRRIERDLHDGAQQRLVSVAMTLGQAKERLSEDPARAQALLDEAHTEAKRALVELRDLARGLHPAVLTDRGLDGALAALAARCPVSVTLDVSVSPRPTAEVEAIAYFFVAEALTNVARHSAADSVSITARRAEDRLRVEVRDDGRGGAREDAGSGLAGLRERAHAVDGTFSVRSVPDEGTTLHLDLPCQN